MRALLFAAALLILPALVAAQERTILAVILNSVPQDDVFVVRTPEGPWMAVADLEAMGLRGFAGKRRAFGESEHVLLPSLAPGLRVDINDRDLTMAITAMPDLFPPTVLTAIPSRPTDLQFVRSFSSSLNYRAIWTSDGGWTGTADLGVSVRGHALTSTGIWESTGRFRRGLTGMTFDVPSARVRIEAGDVAARWSGNLTGGALLGGITIGRENSLDPYYQEYHVPGFDGQTTLPSSAEVYVNGLLQRTFDLNPGMFRIDGLPVTAGRGDITVRVRDAMGQTQELRRNYYLSTQLLGRGRHDFRVTGGLKRNDEGRQPTYRDWAFVGGYRVGLSQWLTFGTSAEGDASAQSGSLGLGLGAAWLGEFSVDGAISRDRSGEIGYAASAAWNRTARSLTMSASGQWFDARYYGLGNRPGDRARPWSARASMAAPLWGIGSISLQGGVQDAIEILLPTNPLELPEIVESRLARVGVSLDLRVTRRAGVRATTYWNRNADRGIRYWETSVGLVLSPGKKVSIAAEAIRDSEGDAMFTDINRPLPRARGVGFRLRSTGPLQRDRQRIQGLVEAQNSLGRATISHERDLLGQSSTSAIFEGGVVQVGSVFALSRPVNSSFVLVRVPGERGVTVYRDHDTVGRTGRSGHLLVPDLQAYYGNVLGIEDTDLPLDVLVDRTRAVVAPPFRGGAVLTFPVRLLRAYTGTVRLDPWPPDKARYGTLLLRRAGRDWSTSIAADGAFYLDDVEPGDYEVTVEMGDATCVTTLRIPEGQALTTTLPEVVCRTTAGTGR